MCVRKVRTGVSYVEINSQILQRINWADLEQVNNFWLRRRLTLRNTWLYYMGKTEQNIASSVLNNTFEK